LTPRCATRGVKDPAASLTAEAGIVVFPRRVRERWVDDRNRTSLAYLIRESRDELRAVTTGP
jgi:hypothetical protein